MKNCNVCKSWNTYANTVVGDDCKIPITISSPELTIECSVDVCLDCGNVFMQEIKRD